MGNLINAMEAKIDETGAYEAAHSKGFEDGYEAGLDAAWNIAGRIVVTSCSIIDNLFNISNWYDVFVYYTAKEAIQRLKEYDYQKQCEEAKAARQKIIIEDLKEMYKKYSPDEVFAAQKEIDIDGR